MTREELMEETRKAISDSPALQILLKLDDSELIFINLVNMYAAGVKAGMLKALMGNYETDKTI